MWPIVQLFFSFIFEMKVFFLQCAHPPTLTKGLVIKSLTPQPVGDPLQLAVMEEDSGMLDIGDESDGVMESIQYEEEGEGEGEGEEEGWFIDSRLLQKDFIAKQYSLALFTYKKVSKVGNGYFLAMYVVCAGHKRPDGFLVS